MQTPRRPLGQLRRALLIASAFSAFSAAALLAVPVFALQMVEAALPTGSLEVLLVLTGIAGVALLTAWVVDFSRELVLVRTGVWLEHTLQPMIIQNGLARGFDGNRIKSLTENVTVVRRALVQGSLPALLELPWLLAACSLVIFVHPHLAIACAAAVALPLTFSLVALRRSRQNIRDDAAAWLDGVMGDAPRLAAGGYSSGIAQKWSQLDRQRVGASYAVLRRRAVLRSVVRLLVAAGCIGVLACGGYLVVAEAMLPGAAVAAALLVARIGASVDQVMVGCIDIAAARAAWRNISSSEVEQAPGKTAAKSSPEWITLENVTARYGQSQSPALRDAKLAIAPGECIGVIGPRASGKSSLLAIIAGELAPMSGMAAIGNAAIGAFQRQSETRAVGYLGDTPFLLAGTVAENISGFAPSSEEQVIAAAIRAGAHDAISALPEGYATEVGNGGTAISMRARRAIALARALYGNPIAVVLDEPEIGLDATERSRLVGILDAIRRDGVTMVIATGDPSLLRLTDRIALMSNGTIEAVLPSGQVTGARHVTARQVA